MIRKQMELKAEQKKEEEKRCDKYLYATFNKISVVNSTDMADVIFYIALN